MELFEDFGEIKHALSEIMFDLYEEDFREFSINDGETQERGDNSIQQILDEIDHAAHKEENGLEIKGRGVKILVQCWARCGSEDEEAYSIDIVNG